MGLTKEVYYNLKCTVVHHTIWSQTAGGLKMQGSLKAGTTECRSVKASSCKCLVGIKVTFEICDVKRLYLLVRDVLSI